MRKGRVYRRSGGWGFRVDVALDPGTGKRQQHSQQGFPTKGQAVGALDQVLAETEPPRIGSTDPLSVRQVAQSWLERKTQDCAESTFSAYGRSVAKICDRLGDVIVGDLTVAMVDDSEGDLLRAGSSSGGALSAKSVLAVHAVRHQVLDDAVRRSVVPTNGAASASPPRHEAEVVANWSLDEVKAFLGVSQDHRLQPAFVVLLATGLTRGELVGLRWDDIDLDVGAIVVRRIVSMTLGKRTESAPAPSAQRTVAIAGRTVGVLRSHRDVSGTPGNAKPVFQKRGGGELNPESLSATFQRLVDRAGVSPMTISGLRHTHAALALKAGINPLVVSKRLGHSTSARTQEMYGHLIPPLRDAQLSTLEATLFDVPG